MKKIYIVDDMAHIRRLLTAFFKKRNMEVEIKPIDIVMYSEMHMSPVTIDKPSVRDIVLAGHNHKIPRVPRDVAELAMISIDDLRARAEKVVLEIRHEMPQDLPVLKGLVSKKKPTPHFSVQRKLPPKHAGKHGKFSRSHRWR